MNLNNAFGTNGNGNGHTGGTPLGDGGISAFDGVAAAPEFAPGPGGIYSVRVLKGEFCSTKAGAEAYRIRFQIVEGPEVGKTLIRTWTFGAKALAYTKRDLGAFGLTTSSQLLSPFPEPCKEYLCRLMVALQPDNDGVKRNDIKRIDAIKVVVSPAASLLLPKPQSEGVVS